MAWLRGGDTAPTHPVALAILGHTDADDRTLNELFGFVMRCAMASTAHNIEYRITRGTAVLMAGSTTRAQELIDLALWAGYFTEVQNSQGMEYELFQDDEFIHLIPWDQREWAKQQKRDRNNWALVVPVRLRDGDGCRYCGRVVQWENNRAALAGTYDHLNPGQPATIDTYVVACRGCNSKYGETPYSEKKDELLPPPLEPYLSEYTVTFLREKRWVKDNDVKIPNPTQRRLSPGALAVNKKTSAGNQSAKADGPRGNSTEHTPASASGAGHADSNEGRPPSTVSTASTTTNHHNRPAAGTQPASKPAEQGGAWSVGLSDCQSERDPASVNGSGPWGNSGEHTPAERDGAWSVGLSGCQSERDPASTPTQGQGTNKPQPEQDPPQQHPNEHRKSAAPAPLSRSSQGKTQQRADSAPNLLQNCRPLPESAPNVDHHVGQTRVGSGRDGSERSRVETDRGRDGSGRDGPDRGWTGTGRERASSSPKITLPRKRRRR